MTSGVKDARFRLTRALASPPRRPGSDPGLSWLHPLGSYMGKGHETGCVAQRPSSLCSLIGQSFMNVTLSRGPGVGLRAWKGKRSGFRGARRHHPARTHFTPKASHAPSGDGLHGGPRPRGHGGKDPVPGVCPAHGRKGLEGHTPGGQGSKVRLRRRAPLPGPSSTCDLGVGLPDKVRNWNYR